MPQVLNSLLIGIGFAVDEKSADNVESSIDSIQSKALQLGSLVAGAFGANALTFGFASAYDELGKFGQRFNVAAEDVITFDRALQHAGGTAGEFYGSVARLTQLQSLSAQGKAGILSGLAPEGISDQVARVINASDALEGFLSAADAMEGLDLKRQERFIQALGFTDAEVGLLRSGREGILAAVDAERKLRPVTDEMTDSAAAFNDQWQDINSNVGGFADKIATPLVKGISEVLGKTNQWIGANRELINQFASIGGKAIGDNIEVISVALGSFAAAGVIAGLKSVAVLVAGISASLVAGAAAAAPWVAAATAIYTIASQSDELKSAGEDSAFKALKTINDLTGIDLSSDSKFTPSTNAELDAMRASLFKGINGNDSKPIVINHQTILDGKVVESSVTKVIGEQAEQAIQDLSNSEAG